MFEAVNIWVKKTSIGYWILKNGSIKNYQHMFYFSLLLASILAPQISRHFHRFFFHNFHQPFTKLCYLCPRSGKIHPPSTHLGFLTPWKTLPSPWDDSINDLNPCVALNGEQLMYISYPTFQSLQVGNSPPEFHGGEEDGNPNLYIYI